MLKVLNGALVFLLIIGLLSCSSNRVDNEELKEEVISIHDEVMPKMGELKSLQKEFSQKAQQLTLEDSVAHKEEVKELKNVAQELEQAYEGMFEWMRQFEVDFQDMTEEEVTQYLNEQKEKVKQVNKSIKEALEKAEKLKSE
ncbi:hypothetical protein QWY93_11640 [Echinicola jeungdonensis]|uniref:Viral A-type inclusion protein n=1 Tax=Echinicola jeungdonensis TaxID=709343 RepID=A0ABV5J801_9BACT|nr:hypothetical protein [Echinicola jeungdonensis]MDN3669979.1 hypothetical protein [Echinicola jeungdonensis]